MLYDSNAPLSDVLPELTARYGDFYRMMGLRELGERMFGYLKREEPNQRLNEAFNTLPQAEMTPREAFLKIVSGDVEMVPCEKLFGRIAANSIIPYPPGIPMLMSGENFGSANSPQIAYLKSLLAWNRQFPGFEHITEGVELKNDNCYVMCIKKS